VIKATKATRAHLDRLATKATRDQSDRLATKELLAHQVRKERKAQLEFKELLVIKE
jgi:hypothetical protein